MYNKRITYNNQLIKVNVQTHTRATCTVVNYLSIAAKSVHIVTRDTNSTITHVMVLLFNDTNNSAITHNTHTLIQLYIYTTL